MDFSKIWESLQKRNGQMKIKRKRERERELKNCKFLSNSNYQLLTGPLQVSIECPIAIYERAKFSCRNTWLNRHTTTTVATTTSTTATRKNALSKTHDKKAQPQHVVSLSRLVWGEKVLGACRKRQNEGRSGEGEIS